MDIGKRCLACRRLQENPPIQCHRKRKINTLLCNVHSKQKKVRYFSKSEFASRIQRCWRSYKFRSKVEQFIRLKNHFDFVTNESHWEMEEKEIIFWGDYFARRDSIQDWINSECFIREREKPRNPYSLEPLPDEILSIFPPQLMRRDDSDNLYWKNKVLNCFRTIDDHGYYTDPSWIFETSHRQWQKFVHLLDKSIEEAEMHLPTYELILINQLYPFVDFFDMEPDYENAIGTIMLKLEELIRKQSEYEDRKLCCWWILDSLQHIVQGGIEGITDMEEREEQSRELHFLEQYFGIPIRFMMHRGDMPFHL